MARRLLSRSLLSRMLDSSAASSLVNVQAALVAVESSSASCSLFRQCRIHWSQPQTIQVAAYAKQAKGKGKGKGSAAQAAEQDDQPAIEFSLDEPTQAMETTLERFQHELAGVRTGRANPGLIDTLVVDVHGDRMPLKACGTVTVRGSQTLAVAVYDPSMVPDVIKAIKNSPLGLNPQQESGEILVKVPKMSKDTIEKMVKLVHMEAETAKVSIRHARQKAIDVAKKAFSSTDERKAAEKRVQALTDSFISEVDRLKAIKDKELREHES